MERLDKVLANMGYGSRKEVKKIIKEGKVEVDGLKELDNKIKVDPEKSKIKVFGELIDYRENIYLMMNKPEGVISATFDDYDETVIDIIDPKYKVFDPFPVGRLDKDTVGLLLITNDGDLNHKLISPKNNIDKVYYVEVDGKVDNEDIKEFKKGIILDDGYSCMPAGLEILKCDNDGSRVKVTLQEGKFHQIKRMFKSRGKNVVYLKRISFGPLKLDESLEEGEYRELSKDEMKKLKLV